MPGGDEGASLLLTFANQSIVYCELTYLIPWDNKCKVGKV